MLLITSLNDGKEKAEVFIQHHEALQWHSILYLPTRAPWCTQTARTDRQWAGKKQTTQDFFILAVKLDSALMCLCDKN